MRKIIIFAFIISTSFILKSQNNNPPENLEAIVNEDDVVLLWEVPENGEWLRYTIEDSLKVLQAYFTGDPVDAAIRFDRNDLKPYHNWQLRKVAFRVGNAKSDYRVRVWVDGSITSQQEGDMVADIPMASVEFIEWNYCTLSLPIVVDSTKELWFGYHVSGYDSTQAENPVAMVDKGPAVIGKGGLFQINNQWNEMYGQGFDCNFHIKGHVTNLLGYNIYRDNQLVAFIDNPYATSYIDSDLAFANYTYTIKAVYSEGESIASNAQLADPNNPMYLIRENFETGFPTDWTKIDADQDTFNWRVVWEHEPVIMSWDIYNGLHSIVSESYYNYGDQILSPDNYLITKQIHIQNPQTSLQYYVMHQDAYWAPEKYKVKISTTGTSITDFNETIYEEDIYNYFWHKIDLSLADYVGEDIYIAFEHTGVTDMFAITLDNILVVDSALVTTNSIITYDNNISILPNPINSIAHIKFTLQSPQTINYIIYNINGKQVYNSKTKHYSKGEYSLSWKPNETLSDGVYIIKIFGNNNLIHTQKLLYSKN